MKNISLGIAVLLAAASSIGNTQELAADAEAPQAAAMPPVKPDVEVSAAKVTKALENTKGVPSRDITVSTHASAVVLTGKVDSEAQRATANSVAEKAAEGARVSTNIEVRPPEDRPVKQQLADQQAVQLVRDVEAALAADTRTRNLGVAVTTDDSRVIVLQGLVPSRESRTTAQTVASRVKGVARIDNRLIVP